MQHCNIHVATWPQALHLAFITSSFTGRVSALFFHFNLLRVLSAVGKEAAPFRTLEPCRYLSLPVATCRYLSLPVATCRYLSLPVATVATRQPGHTDRENLDFDPILARMCCLANGCRGMDWGKREPGDRLRLWWVWNRGGLANEFGESAYSAMIPNDLRLFSFIMMIYDDFWF